MSNNTGNYRVRWQFYGQSGSHVYRCQTAERAKYLEAFIESSIHNVRFVAAEIETPGWRPLREDER